MKGFFKSVMALILILTASAWATNVTFRVNMSYQDQLNRFDPATDYVYVRGEFNSWGLADTLVHLGNGVYGKTKDLAPATYQYKFCFIHAGNENWEGDPNREVAVGNDPMELPIVWFNRQEPVPTTNVEGLFAVNMTVAIQTGRFNPASDWVIIRGSHPNIGGWGGETRLLEETGNPGVYITNWIQFPDMPVGSPLEWKYCILTGGSGGAVTWESGSNRSVTPTGQEPDNYPPGSPNGFGELNIPEDYFDRAGPGDILQRDVLVILSVDARPFLGRLAAGGGYFVQGGDTIRSLDAIHLAGPFNGWPWNNFGPEYLLNDSGVRGDLVAGDTVWTVSKLFPQYSVKNLEYKYSGNGRDIEAGFARNHNRLIDDSQAEWRAPTDCYGSPDTLYMRWPCTMSGIDQIASLHPVKYELEQNYPNPFNPETRISFSISRPEYVRLSVFDILGREVATLVEQQLGAGSYMVPFNASSLPSGLYLYRLEAGSFHTTRKMLLLK